MRADGYIFVSRPAKKDWKRRWAIYQRATRSLCLYQARESKQPLSTLAFYAQAIEAPFRGRLVVHHAMKKAAPKLPFAFMCFSDDGQGMHLSADGPEDLTKWLEAMALDEPPRGANAPPPPDASAEQPVPLAGEAHARKKGEAHAKGWASLRQTPALEGAMLSAMRAEVRHLREKVAERKKVRESAREGHQREEVGLVWLDEGANKPPPPPSVDADPHADIAHGRGRGVTVGEGVVIALEHELTRMGSSGLLGGAASPPPPPDDAPPPPAMEEGSVRGGAHLDLERYDSIMSSMSDAEEEEAHAAQLAEYALMAAQAEDDWNDDDDDVMDTPPLLHVGLSAEQLAAHAKPVLNDAGRHGLVQDEHVAKELEELKAMLEAARQENLKLKVEVGGATSANEEMAQMATFLSLLAQVVQMRREARFDKELFESYNAAMVELSEEHIKEM